jgi:hypothetical protein
MKKLLMSTSVIVLAMSVGPAYAQSTPSTFGIGGGLTFGHVGTLTGAGVLGNGAATAAAAGVNNTVGAGTAVSTPLGGFSAGIGASIGQTAGQSAAPAGPLGGGAISGSLVNNLGVGVGGGFSNQTP